jgi:hypothetical protein
MIHHPHRSEITADLLCRRFADQRRSAKLRPRKSAVISRVFKGAQLTITVIHFRAEVTSSLARHPQRTVNSSPLSNGRVIVRKPLAGLLMNSK